MLIKTSSLIGLTLDWAVAQCEGPESVAACYLTDTGLRTLDEAAPQNWSPSTDWAQGGPIIERDRINIATLPHFASKDITWAAMQKNLNNDTTRSVFGPTALIAAMRCHVTQCLGDEIGVPDELAVRPL